MMDLEKMISKLSPERLARYLSIHNWVEIDSLFEDKVRQFLNPQQGDAILLPTDNSFSDYNKISKRTQKSRYWLCCCRWLRRLDRYNL